MSEEGEERKTFFDRYLLLPVVLLGMFVAPNYMGDVSLEGLDAYVLSAPAGTSRDEMNVRLAHFQHCYYRSPSRVAVPGGMDYVYRGTTSDVGYFASVTVHCPYDGEDRLAAQCTRTEWTLIPADVEGWEKRTNSDITQDPEWSNAGDPDCPVLD